MYVIFYWTPDTRFRIIKLKSDGNKIPISLSDGKRPSIDLQLFKKLFSFFITFTQVACFACDVFLYDQKTKRSDEKIELSSLYNSFMGDWGKERNKHRKKI